MPVWYPYYAKDVEKVQQRATKLLSNLPYETRLLKLEIYNFTVHFATLEHSPQYMQLSYTEADHFSLIRLSLNIYMCCIKERVTSITGVRHLSNIW